VPLPVPLAPPVIVIHDALLVAVHAQPVTLVRATLPVEAAPLTDTLVGESDALHGDEKANVFDWRLTPSPCAPTAMMRTSYVVPGAGRGLRIVPRSTRIFPSVCGAGLPMSTLREGVVDPAV
jgi:hypothetical protein